MKSNRFYRFGDLIFARGRRWENDRKIILKNSNYKNSLLRVILEAADIKEVITKDKLSEICQNYIYPKSFSEFENILNIQIRTGDVVANPQGIIGKHRGRKIHYISNPEKLLFDIDKYLNVNKKINSINIITAMHFGDNDVHDIWRFNKTLLEKNKQLIYKIFYKINKEFDLPITVEKSHECDIKNTDSNFLKLCYSKDVILDHSAYCDLIRLVRGDKLDMEATPMAGIDGMSFDEAKNNYDVAANSIITTATKATRRQQ
tara:strand:- start:182 stop:961 length:780 start_codon:yes stop_codon:yes gene_type:complete